ncbi:MAG: LacI family DNA-binding transcriptional regulator [Octadecabacter sp.]|nr:LacI family DNA-binding transcriptional regulator [Octadecabacter sp.]
MAKRTTLKDIAKASGVHVSTVSRALDPQRSLPLTAEVVDKVRAAAKEMDYRPNRVAYSLRTNRTMTIGVMIPDITNMIFPPIVRGIERVMEPAGYASIIVNTDSQRGRETALLQTLQDRGVDGIIHTAALRNEPSIVRAAQSGLSVVTLNRKLDDTDVPYVINDEVGGIRLVFDLLRNYGHQRIAHLAGPSDLSTGLLRRNAFSAACADTGIDPLNVPIVEANRFDEDEGRRCAIEILDKSPETTAILAANDRLALGAIMALRERGLSCPRDVSVTGFNDMPFLDMIPPGLTTIRIRQNTAGEVAARHLLAIMQRKGAEVPLETILPVSLVERASVAPPAPQALAAKG